MILTSISLLMPTFSLVYSPLLLTVQLQPVYDALLPLARILTYLKLAVCLRFKFDD